MVSLPNNEHFSIAYDHNLELAAKIAMGEVNAPSKHDPDFFLYYSLVDRLCLDDGIAVEAVIAHICNCALSPGRNDFDAVCNVSTSAIELKTNHITIPDIDALEEAKHLQQELKTEVDKKLRRELSAEIKRLSMGKKFTMRGVFSDITKKSWLKYKNSDDALIHVALMLNERLIAVIEFPIRWKTFTLCIEDQLERCVKDASFSPTHYNDCPQIRARWIIDPEELKSIRFLFSANNFALISRLSSEFHDV